MFGFRVLAAATAVLFVIAPAFADDRVQVAKTELGDPNSPSAERTDIDIEAEDDWQNTPVDPEAIELNGHQAMDSALPPASVAALSKEVEQAEPLERPEPTLFADINLTTQRMTVRDAAGNKYGPWKISSARGGYTTPTGTYSPHWTSRMHYSKQYHNSPMPYSVFFHRGVATHGTRAVGRLGHPASHGCVRLRTSNAKTFYKLVEKHGKKLTKIVVHGKPPYTPVAKKYKKRRRYAKPKNQPFFFGSPPPTYQQKRRRRYGSGSRYGGGYY